MIDKITSVKQKLADYVSNHKQLSNEYDTLLEEVSGIRDRLKEQETEVEKLTQALNVAKMAKTLNGEGGESNEELKQKIDKFIREIDRCIALVTQK